MSKLHRIQRQSNAAFRNQPTIPLHPGPAASSEYVWVKKTQPKPKTVAGTGGFKIRKKRK